VFYELLEENIIFFILELKNLDMKPLKSSFELVSFFIFYWSAVNMSLNFVVLALVAFFGACMGSFAALIIYRWPLEISIVHPRSFCGSCKQAIKFYHNIPVISWLVLRGHCASCKIFFGWRNFIIELIFMLVSLAIFVNFGLSVAACERFGFIFLLLCLAYIDLDTFYLPLNMLLLLILWGLVFTGIYYFFPELYFPIGQNYFFLKILVFKNFPNTILDRLLGAAIGGLFFAILNLTTTALLRMRGRLDPKQWAMGWGDPVLLLAIGLFVGLSHLVLVLFLASFTGVIISLLNMLLQKSPNNSQNNTYNIAEGAVPYGPFLALAAIYVYLF
jgi:leader peptidase (prepilin peptidase)/N-methyltransferase